METTGRVLSAEHKNILKAIGALKREYSKLEAGSSLDEKFFYNAVDFIRNYADRFHHAKEEGILFRELRKMSGFPQAPINVMLHEHAIGRDYVAQMDDALKSKNQESLMAAANGYANLLEQHIYKEDHALFPMADKSLDAKLQNLMLSEFAEIERNFTTLGKYISLAKEFEVR